jgi:hypothetical protein
MHQIQPTIGQWYLRPESGRKFEVIDIDDGDGMIEIQDDEGALDQIDSDTWFADTLEATDQPQNAIGAFDNVSETDEADGGDATDINALDMDPLRVAQEEMLEAASVDSDAVDLYQGDLDEDDLDQDDIDPEEDR